MKRKYERAYRPEWEQDPLLSSWISRAKHDPDVAFRKACNTKLVTRLSALKEHASINKHKKNLTRYSGQSSVQQFFKKSPLEDEVKKAELNMCALLVEHNLPFRLMDHMSEIIPKCFSNPEVAKLFSCKRTKAAAITYNVLKSCQNISTRAPVYSLIMDESTDVSSTKMLAIVTKYYSEKSLALKTKFLTSVDLEWETVQNLFDALSRALSSANLNIKDAVGFGADTTNVMFGERGGIVAKIRDVNPHCVFIKCVCHSTALSVSHASKDTLPRAVNQEVYGYFAHSSKRQRELSEFQEFVSTEKHKILQHYDIRWLSFHSCVNRILEQWDALKLYFQGEYLVDKNISSQFLYDNFSDKILKLYFYALDYVLPIVNKLNTIFQGDYATVHTVFKDVSEMFVTVELLHEKQLH